MWVRCRGPVASSRILCRRPWLPRPYGASLPGRGAVPGLAGCWSGFAVAPRSGDGDAGRYAENMGALPCLVGCWAAVRLVSGVVRGDLLKANETTVRNLLQGERQYV